MADQTSNGVSYGYTRVEPIHDPLCPKNGLHPADEAMMAIVVECRCEEYARVRADERGWIAQANADSIEAEVRERLRAQVEGLVWKRHPDLYGDLLSRDQVLALLGGESDG